MKRTPWYPVSIEPVRNGVYEVSLRDTSAIIRLQYSKGRGWAWPLSLKLDGDRWRGLTRKAK